MYQRRSVAIHLYCFGCFGHGARYGWHESCWSLKTPVRRDVHGRVRRFAGGKRHQASKCRTRVLYVLGVVCERTWREADAVVWHVAGWRSGAAGGAGNRRRRLEQPPLLGVLRCARVLHVDDVNFWTGWQLEDDTHTFHPQPALDDSQGSVEYKLLCKNSTDNWTKLSDATFFVQLENLCSSFHLNLSSYFLLHRAVDIGQAGNLQHFDTVLVWNCAVRVKQWRKLARLVWSQVYAERNEHGVKQPYDANSFMQAMMQAMEMVQTWEPLTPPPLSMFIVIFAQNSNYKHPALREYLCKTAEIGCGVNYCWKGTETKQDQTLHHHYVTTRIEQRPGQGLKAHDAGSGEGLSGLTLYGVLPGAVASLPNRPLRKLTMIVVPTDMPPLGGLQQIWPSLIQDSDTDLGCL